MPRLQHRRTTVTLPEISSSCENLQTECRLGAALTDMKHSMLLALLFLTALANAQGENALHPEAVENCVQNHAVKGRFIVNFKTNPYYLRGDFDGDGEPDYAVAIRGKKTMRNGVLICTARKQVFVLGADNPLTPPFSFFEYAWRQFRSSPLASPDKGRDQGTRQVHDHSSQSAASAQRGDDRHDLGRRHIHHLLGWRRVSLGRRCQMKRLIK